jgi:rifampicin phosphotransferase
MIDALKSYLAGASSSPYERQSEAETRREQANRTVLARTRWPVKGWYRRLLKWAQETNPMREDSIFDMGMGHPIVRRMFAELAGRLISAGAIDDPQDIYWLDQAELNMLVAGLEKARRCLIWQTAFPSASSSGRRPLNIRRL